MYSYTFTRNQMGIGAASAVIMLMMIASIIVPTSMPSCEAAAVAHSAEGTAVRTDRLARAVIYAALILFICSAAAVRDAGQLGQAAGRDPRRQHAGVAGAVHHRALAQRLEHGADRGAADQPQAVFLELDQDGGAVAISTLLGALSGYVLTKWRLPATTSCSA